MSVWTREELKRLVGPHERPCVSILMPTHLGASHSQEDEIRFKNLLGEVEARVGAMPGGLDREKFLEPLRTLSADGLFWRRQRAGLAVFRSAEAFFVYRLPMRPPTLASVTERFLVKPLLPLLWAGGRYFVLALSQKGAKLYEGSYDSLDAVDIESMPPSLAETIRTRPGQLQIHASGAPGGRMGTGTIHGQGGIEEDKDELLRIYFRRVDAALHGFLRDEKLPLILAGVDYYFPIYKEANTYPHLIDEHVSGSTETMELAELHRKATTISRERVDRQLADITERFKTALAHNRASIDIRHILRWAAYGRVGEVFVPSGVQLWGTFDRGRGAVTVSELKRPWDEDLFDHAAIETLLHGGLVYAVEPSRMPDGHAIAAILRY